METLGKPYKPPLQDLPDHSSVPSKGNTTTQSPETHGVEFRVYLSPEEPTFLGFPIMISFSISP